jgi:hypothetical protein
MLVLCWGLCSGKATYASRLPLHVNTARSAQWVLEMSILVTLLGNGKRSWDVQAMDRDLHLDKICDMPM